MATPGTGPGGPERHDRHRRCAAHRDGHRRVHPRQRRRIRAAGEGEPPGPVRCAGCAALGSGPGRRQPDRGHGRVTTRIIQVMPAPEDLPFPHVSQALLIERYVSDLAGNPLSAVAALGVASPGPDKASPADLARYVRGQWAIESLHWLRDTLYQEDKSRVRTRSGPRIMAAMRNLAISALRLAGRSMDRPFTILGLT